METFQKMVKLEEYLGNEIRYIQWTLEVKKLSHEEFLRLARSLDSCEKLHMIVLDKVLPY